MNHVTEIKMAISDILTKYSDKTNMKISVKLAKVYEMCKKAEVQD